MKWIALLMIAVMLNLSSCKKFLDVAPNKASGVVPTTITDLDNILNDQALFTERTEAFRGTDDYELSPEFWDVFAGRGMNVTRALWAVNDRSPEGTQSFEDLGYTQEYRKIFTANLILSNLGKVSGTDEAKAQLASEAYFLRAYSYWVLANTYCLPYLPENANKPGLPLKLSTSFEEDLTRVPLSRVYEQIEADLAEARKTTLEPVTGGSLKNWRANKAAVHCFAARYYLNRNNYAKALEEANATLNIYNQVLDYNVDVMETAPRIPVTINKNSTDPNFPEQTFELITSNKSSWIGPQDKDILYHRMVAVFEGWVPMSQNLQSLYDKDNDLRWKYDARVGALNYNFGYTTNIKAWASWSGLGHASHYLLTGLNVPEALLIKAECLARANDIEGAMTTVNLLRVKRIRSAAGASIINLSATTQREAIEQVLLERRREMPLAMRWYDIRRLNHNDDSGDDVIVSKQMYDFDVNGVKTPATVKTYTLEKNSPRYALPIPLSEIISGNGVIVQNQY